MSLTGEDAMRTVERHLERLASEGTEFGVEQRGENRMLVFPLRPLRKRCSGTLSSQIETVAVALEFRPRRSGSEARTEVHAHITQHLVVMARLFAFVDAVCHLGTNVVADVFATRGDDWEIETRARHGLFSLVLQPLTPFEVAPASTGSYRRVDSTVPMRR